MSLKKQLESLGALSLVAKSSMDKLVKDIFVDHTLCCYNSVIGSNVGASAGESELSKLSCPLLEQELTKLTAVNGFVTITSTITYHAIANYIAFLLIYSSILNYLSGL